MAELRPTATDTESRHSQAWAACRQPDLVNPGECGGRSDVRWLALAGRSGPGLAVAALAGPRSLQMNVSRCAALQPCLMQLHSLLHLRWLRCSSLLHRPFAHSALSRNRFSLAALAAAKHEYELSADARTHVHLDACHMGVGGDDSWSPSVLKVWQPHVCIHIFLRLVHETLELE